MKKLKIGYWPLSSNLNSAGDRRRLVFWAAARGHTIVTDLTQKVDLIVASENADFNSWVFNQRKTPIILDLVDAYLSPLNALDDLARGIAKKFTGQLSGVVKPFSHHVRDFCLNSDAVLCSSVEQEKIIQSYNINTHVILDSHEEIPMISSDLSKLVSSNENRILWEGQPATIRGVKQLSNVFFNLIEARNLCFDFVTDQTYFEFLNKYLEKDTLGLLKKDLRRVSSFVRLTPWTPENLVSTARNSSIAIIPIDLAVPIQKLKPENRLLIMMRLGLPCLTSPSPAYARVARAANLNSVCDSPQAWLANINRLLDDRSFANDEVLRGRNYLHEYHNRAILLKKWDRAIESVVG